MAPGVADLPQLRQFMLEIINRDRADFGLPAVRLGTNTAAQKHAEDMLAKYYLGHVDNGGMKPYMHYSLAGGLGAVGENAGYADTMNPQDSTRYERLDPRQWP